MKYVKRFRVAPGSKVKLKDVDPGFKDHHKGHKEAAEEMEQHQKKLRELQELLYADGQCSLLICLQGMDTGGKDGTINHILGAMNPQGCRVVGFRQPSAEELAHDFLWRIHQATPPRGKVAIFNRSHYEDVLVARVDKLVPKDVWKSRFEQINDFERLLIANGTIVLKFFLYISKDQQRERLMARENDREKAWKLSRTDWVTFDKYDAYIDAYEDVLEKCSPPEAPWYIVPANHKWYRNLAVAHTIDDALEPYSHDWRAKLRERGERILKEIADQRRGEPPERSRRDRVLSDG